jgi:hypothetical protein
VEREGEIVIVHIKPIVGDRPADVEPCIGVAKFRPGPEDRSVDINLRYISGPKEWTFVGDGPGWTAIGVFDAFGHLLYRLMTFRRPMIASDTVTAVF